MAGQNVKTTTDSSFQEDVLGNATPAVVDFWATWCGPCRALAPVIEQLADENTGKINVYKLDVDENPDVAAKFGIRGIPTVLFFKDGKVVEQSVGVLPKTDLQKLIDKTVAA